MAKTTIVGDAVVVTSTKTLEDIKTLEKYRPKALCLYETDEDGKKQEIFKIGSTSGEGSLGTYGASFGGVTHDDAKLATITMCLPKSVTDVKEYVAEKYGPALLNLNKVEEQFEAALAEIEAQKAAVMENITVAQ